MQQTCTKCGVSKSVTEFNFRNKVLGKRFTRCKSCTREVTRNAYWKRRTYYLRKQAMRNKINKIKALEFVRSFLKKSVCIDCGENDSRVLQFDHVRGKKKMAVSRMSRSFLNISALQQEISKCEVRCANCHARRTAKVLGYYAYMDVLD